MCDLTTHFKNNFIKLPILVFLFLLGGCFSHDEPQNYPVNEHKCDFCMMGIADLRFRGQIVTKKGKYYHFDSVECTLGWSQKNSENVDKIWVSNYSSSGEWVLLDDAHILHSTKINSPMGAGLAAFKSTSELEKTKSIYGGEIFTKSDLNEHVQKWRKKF